MRRRRKQTERSRPEAVSFSTGTESIEGTYEVELGPTPKIFVHYRGLTASAFLQNTPAPALALLLLMELDRDFAAAKRR